MIKFLYLRWNPPYSDPRIEKTTTTATKKNTPIFSKIHFLGLRQLIHHFGDTPQVVASFSYL